MIHGKLEELCILAMFVAVVLLVLGWAYANELDECKQMHCDQGKPTLVDQGPWFECVCTAGGPP